MVIKYSFIHILYYEKATPVLYFTILYLMFQGLSTPYLNCLNSQDLKSLSK